VNKIIFLFLSAFTLASAEVTRLPEEFTIAERFLSFASTFDINTALEPLAVARKRFLTLTTTFDLEDPNGLPLASAEARFFSWGTTVDVTDPTDQKIGWIEEEVFKIIPWAEYRVFNFEDRLVAMARMNFWGTQFDIYHPDHPEEIYATLNRPFFRCFYDHWTVQIKQTQIFEEKIIDPRLLIILAIYQTDGDNRRRIRAVIEQQLRNDQEYYDNRRYE